MKADARKARRRVTCANTLRAYHLQAEDLSGLKVFVQEGIDGAASIPAMIEKCGLVPTANRLNAQVFLATSPSVLCQRDTWAARLIGAWVIT